MDYRVVDLGKGNASQVFKAIINQFISEGFKVSSSPVRTVKEEENEYHRIYSKTFRSPWVIYETEEHECFCHEPGDGGRLQQERVLYRTYCLFSVPIPSTRKEIVVARDYSSWTSSIDDSTDYEDARNRKQTLAISKDIATRRLLQKKSNEKLEGRVLLA
jgi:hypothetical protein